MNSIAGVFAAVPTPIDGDGNPDIAHFLEQCEWVLGNGCNGLNVLGTTGEANSQSGRARTELMRATAASSLKSYPLMVGTGTASLADTIELTLLAAELGFDGALVLPPYYYKGVSDDGLFAYFDAVLRSLHGTDTGVYLYNFPQMTGLTFSSECIARLLEAHPDRLCGMKDSSGDLDYTSRIAAEFGGAFDVFPGSEGPLADAVAKGYAGCISASVNATARLAGRVWQSRTALDPADIEHLQSMRDQIAAFPMVAAVKTLVSLRTGDPAWRRVIPPLRELDDIDQQRLAAIAATLKLTD